MRIPSSYPGSARANAAWAWRHLTAPSRPTPAIPSREALPAVGHLGRGSPERPLPARRRGVRGVEGGVLLQQALVPVDASGRLEAVDLRDRVRARQVVRRRERLAPGQIRVLLDDRRPAVRAADGDAHTAPRRAAQLCLDDGGVLHAVRLLAVAAADALDHDRRLSREHPPAAAGVPDDRRARMQRLLEARQPAVLALERGAPARAGSRGRAARGGTSAPARRRAPR